MIFKTANHWCNLVKTGQTQRAGDRQHSFPGETKLKLNTIKTDANYGVFD